MYDVCIRADLLTAVVQLYILHVQLHKCLGCTRGHQSQTYTAHLLSKKILKNNILLVENFGQ